MVFKNKEKSLFNVKKPKITFGLKPKITPFSQPPLKEPKEKRIGQKNPLSKTLGIRPKRRNQEGFK